MPSCSSSPSNIVHAKKDCRVATVEQQQLEQLEFYYCVVGKGWFYKTCVSFSQFLWNNLTRSTIHYQSYHKNRQSYNTLARKCTKVWKMLHEASLTLKINKTDTHRFPLRSFFRFMHLLVKENWAQTHNFKNVVNLVAEFGGKELQTHLLTASKNATYI